MKTQKNNITNQKKLKRRVGFRNDIDAWILMLHRGTI